MNEQSEKLQRQKTLIINLIEKMAENVPTSLMMLKSILPTLCRQSVEHLTDEQLRHIIELVKDFINEVENA